MKCVGSNTYINVSCLMQNNMEDKVLHERFLYTAVAVLSYHVLFLDIALRVLSSVPHETLADA